MYHIIIFDNNECILHYLASLVSDLSKKHNIRIKLNTFSSKSQLSSYFFTNCDIAFLDILHVENRADFTIAQGIKAANPDAQIIFVTKDIEYAPKAFELPAFRYILKGTSTFRSYFEEAFLCAIKKLSGKRKTIKVLSDRELVSIYVDDILYLESFQHQIKIWIKPPEKQAPSRCLLCYSTLKYFEEQLEPLGFLRSQKSFLVNMQKISQFQCDGILLNDGTFLRVSAKNYRTNKQKYFSWKNSQ